MVLHCQFCMVKDIIFLINFHRLSCGETKQCTQFELSENQISRAQDNFGESSASRELGKIRVFSVGARERQKAAALFSQDGWIEFANLQIGFQLAYYRVRLFRLKAGGKGINVDTPRKAGGLLQRPVSHCLRCCSLLSNLRSTISTPGRSPSISLFQLRSTFRFSTIVIVGQASFPITKTKHRNYHVAGINSILCFELDRFRHNLSTMLTCAMYTYVSMCTIFTYHNAFVSNES